MPLAAGTRLGPYEVLESDWRWGLGSVYRARDPRLGRDVAIKVLPDTIAADPDRLRRFGQEARAVAALNHPNILTVHDVGLADATPYVVTELLEGEKLARVPAPRAGTPHPRARSSRREAGPAGARRGPRARAWCTATSSPRTCSSPPTGPP